MVMCIIRKKSTAIKLHFSRHEPTATVPWAWLVYEYEYDVYVAGNYSHPHGPQITRMQNYTWN